MPIIIDDESGKHRLHLSSLVTVEEAVVLYLEVGKANLFYEFSDYENTPEGLEKFLQHLYDRGQIEYAEKGMMFFELFLDGIEKGQLHLYNGRIRLNKLMPWVDALDERAFEYKLDLGSESLSQALSYKNKFKQQENTIIDELRKLDIDPLNLPVSPSGHPGVKAEIRAILDGKGLFNGDTIFTKAWERLRKKGKLKDLN